MRNQPCRYRWSGGLVAAKEEVSRAQSRLQIVSTSGAKRSPTRASALPMTLPRQSIIDQFYKFRVFRQKISFGHLRKRRRYFRRTQLRMKVSLVVDLDAIRHHHVGMACDNFVKDCGVVLVDPELRVGKVCAYKASFDAPGGSTTRTSG